MLTEILALFFLALMFVFSLFVAESKNLMRAALSFALMSISLGIFYIIVGYNLLGVFQILAYTGALVAILLFVIAITKGGEMGE